MIALNLFSGHKLLFGIILILFLVNFGCILYLVIKERKKDEAEIGEIITSLSHAKPRQIEEPTEKVEKKEEIEKEEVEMVEEVNKPKLEIDKVLEKMQKNLETTPEDAVRSFEAEQEEKAIISYHELLKYSQKSDSVVTDTKEMFKADLKEGLEKEKMVPNLENKNQDVKQMLQSDFKEDLEEIDFQEEKKTPQAFPIDFENDMQAEEENTLQIDVIDIEEEPQSISKSAKALEQEAKEKFPSQKKKFQNTDFISPIYGKLDEKEMDYPTVPQFSRTEAIEELLEENHLPKRTHKEGFSETLDVSPLQKEIEDDDEFLKNLKHFRGNL